MTGNNDNNDDSGNEFEALMQIFEGASYLYENRLSPMLDSLSSDTEVDDDIRDPLAESHVKPSKVLIVAEVNDPGQEAKVWESGDSVIIETGGHSFEANVPEDVDLSSIDATINNGVMRVEIPREHDVSLEVSHEQEDGSAEESSDEGSSDGEESDGFHVPDELEKKIDELEDRDLYPDEHMFEEGDE